MGKNRGKNKKVWFMAGETVYPLSHTSPVQVGKPHQHPILFKQNTNKVKKKEKESRSRAS